MSKRKLNLNSPKNRNDGLTQTSFEINYIYVNDNDLTIHTKQGNVVTLAMKPKYQKFIDDVEDEIKISLEAL